MPYTYLLSVAATNICSFFFFPLLSVTIILLLPSKFCSVVHTLWESLFPFFRKHLKLSEHSPFCMFLEKYSENLKLNQSANVSCICKSTLRFSHDAHKLIMNASAGDDRRGTHQLGVFTFVFRQSLVSENKFSLKIPVCFTWLCCTDFWIVALHVWGQPFH